MSHLPLKSGCCKLRLAIRTYSNRSRQ